MTIHNLPRGVPLDFLKLVIPDAISIELDDQNQQFTQENSPVRLGMTKSVGSDHVMKLFTQLFINNEYIVFSKLLSNTQDIPEMKDVLAERERQKTLLREVATVPRDINELSILTEPEKEVVIMMVEDVEAIDRVLLGRGSNWKGPSDPQDLYRAAEEDMRRTGDPNLIVINDDLSDISDTSNIGEDHNHSKKKEIERWNNEGRKSSPSFRAVFRSSKSYNRGNDTLRHRESFEDEYDRCSPSQHSKDHQSQRSGEGRYPSSRQEKSCVDGSTDSYTGNERSQREKPDHGTYHKTKFSSSRRFSPGDRRQRFHGDKQYRDSPRSDHSGRRKSPELGAISQRLGPARDNYGRHTDGQRRQDSEGAGPKYGQAGRFDEERMDRSRDQIMRETDRAGRRLSPDREPGDSRRVVRARSPVKRDDYRMRSSSPRRKDYQSSSAFQTRRISPSTRSGGIGKITVYRKSASPRRPPRSADLSPIRRPPMSSELTASKSRFQRRDAYRTSYSPKRRSPHRNVSRLSPAKQSFRTSDRQRSSRSPVSSVSRLQKKSSLSPISAGDDNENTGGFQAGTWTVPREAVTASTSSAEMSKKSMAAHGDWHAPPSREQIDADIEAKAFLEKFVNEILLQSRATDPLFANTDSQEPSQSSFTASIQDLATVSELRRDVYGSGGSAATDSQLGVVQGGQKHLNTSVTSLAAHHDPGRCGPHEQGRGSHEKGRGIKPHQAYGEVQAKSVPENSEGFLPPPIPPPLFTTSTSSQDRIVQMEALAKQLAVDIQKQSQLSQSTSAGQEMWSVPLPTSMPSVSTMTGPPPGMAAPPPTNFGATEPIVYGDTMPYSCPPADYSGPPPPMRLPPPQTQDIRGLHHPPFWPPGGFY